MSFFVWLFLGGQCIIFQQSIQIGGGGSPATFRCNWIPTRAAESMSGIFSLSVTRHTAIRFTHGQKALINHFGKRPECLCYDLSLESLKSLILHNSFINRLSPMTCPPKYFTVTLLAVIWVAHRHTHAHAEKHIPA